MVYLVSELDRGYGQRPVPFWRSTGAFTGPDALERARKWAGLRGLIAAHDDADEAYAALRAKRLDTTTMRGRVVS